MSGSKVHFIFMSFFLLCEMKPFFFSVSLIFFKLLLHMECLTKSDKMQTYIKLILHLGEYYAFLMSGHSPSLNSSHFSVDRRSQSNSGNAWKQTWLRWLQTHLTQLKSALIQPNLSVLLLCYPWLECKHIFKGSIWPPFSVPPPTHTHTLLFANTLFLNLLVDEQIKDCCWQEWPGLTTMTGAYSFFKTSSTPS